MIDFYKNLFNGDVVNRPLLRFASKFPLVENIHSLNLLRILTLEEVKQAIFFTKATKVPSVNGFPTLFFHKNWSIVAENVISFVQSAFKRDRTL